MVIRGRKFDLEVRSKVKVTIKVQVIKVKVKNIFFYQILLYDRWSPKTVRGGLSGRARFRAGTAATG